MFTLPLISSDFHQAVILLIYPDIPIDRNEYSGVAILRRSLSPNDWLTTRAM